MNWGVDGSGYFYLSYYDKSIAIPETFNYYSDKEATELVEVKNRSYLINQYDLMSASQLFHMYDKKKSSMANIFTADMAKDVATGINGHIQIHPDRGCLRGVEDDYKQACKYRGEVK